MGNITCAKCDYQWEYTGEMFNTTCPRCNLKTPTDIGEDTIPTVSADQEEVAEEEVEGEVGEEAEEPSLEERKVEALERIAAALE